MYSGPTRAGFSEFGSDFPSEPELSCRAVALPFAGTALNWT